MTEKTIDSLVSDLYGLFNGHEVSEGVSRFSSAVGDLFVRRLADKERDRKALSLSQIGRPLRQLYYDLTGGTPDQEKLSSQTKFKFAYGDLIEEMVLFLAMEAGHEVTDMQKTVKVGDIAGHIDCIIDGTLVDVKSCSSYSYNKFATGEILNQDPFGYVDQLSSYWATMPEIKRAGFLAIDKVNGNIVFFELTESSRKSKETIEKRIELIKETVTKGIEPPKCYPDEEDGKSGNRKLSVGCSYCVTPDTKILKSDLSWVPAGDIQKSDKLVGFTFPGSVVSKTADVIGVSNIILPSVRIVTEKGTIVVSSDHQFLSRTDKGHLLHWREAKKLKPRFHRIRFLIDPWIEDTSREGGYLSGFLDGEGCFSDHRLSWAQRPGEVADYVLQAMETRGFKNSYRYVKPNSDCLMWAINGKFEAYRALGILRPKRLLPKGILSLSNRSLKSKVDHDPLVLAIEPIGDTEVVAIETSTGTLITDGYFSHNCAHKFHCWRDANGDTGLKTYIYSTGPRYLSVVAKEPRVQAYDKFPTKKEVQI